MRILHVINSLGASGGAENGMVREIASISDGFEHRVARLFEKDQLDAQLEASGISVVPLGFAASRAGWNWPLATRRLVRVANEFGPDVIHSSLFSANLVAQLTGRQTGVPVLSTFTLSGDVALLKMYQPGADSWRGAALRRFARLSTKTSNASFRALTHDALITNCRLLGVDPGRGSVIPRGIPGDLRPTVRKERADLGLPEDVPLLVNIGRQTAQKGQFTLLEAFRIIRQRVPSYLIMLGRPGDASDALRQGINEMDLADDVSIVGYSPDVFHYLDHASVFVFPSYMEGLGTAVIEAMSFGLPVVAFDIPPVREITDNGRFARLVPVGDAAMFAEQVLDILHLNGVRNQEAEKWVARNYSIGSVARRLEKLLMAVASRG